MLLVQYLVTGIIGTVVLDLWQLLYRRLTGLPPTSWAMIGRWVGHFRDGQFVQQDIGKAAPVRNEAILGWVVHYVVGIGYAVAYLVLTRLLGTEPSLVSAVLFGAISVSVTWFLIEPILGAGVMAANVPDEVRAKVRIQDFTSHLSIGLGIYLGALVTGLA